MPFRAKGIPTGLQIQDYQDEHSPYDHKEGDTIAHMNLDYWLEQVKATVAIAAHLAVPVTPAATPTPPATPTRGPYLPMIMRER